MFKKTLMIMSVFLILMPGIISADEKKLVISATTWEPYTGGNLPGGGLLTEITEEALKRAGYETEVLFVPWKRALLKTEEGEYHALMGAFRSDERAEVLAYPEYGYESQKMFFSLKGRNIRYRKLEDLCPFRLGLLRGSVHTGELAQVRCLKTDFTGDETEAMKILLAGRVDIIVADKENLYYSMEKHFPGRADDVEPAYPPFHTKKVYTVFSKKFPGHRQYVKDYDEGIKRIQEDGTYEKILKKHGVRPLTVEVVQ